MHYKTIVVFLIIAGLVIYLPRIFQIPNELSGSGQLSANIPIPPTMTITPKMINKFTAKISLLERSLKANEKAVVITDENLNSNNKENKK